MLVKELSDNPSCFKIDILRYAMQRKTREILEEKQSNLGEEYYNLIYNDDKEEINANLYGLSKAVAELQKINPNLKKSLIIRNMEINSQKSAINMPVVSKVPLEDLAENILNSAFLKYPEENTGIVSKLYNSDGTRKNFDSLKNDFKMAIETYPNESEVYYFYYYIIYRLLRTMSTEEILSLITSDEDVKLIDACLEGNRNLLMADLEKLNSTHLYFLTGHFKKMSTKTMIEQELQNIDAIQSALQEKNYQGSESYGVK